MRILHCSDLHADDASFHWLVEQSERFDLVCLTGDLLDMNPYRLPPGQIDRVVGYIRQITAPVAICSGNHDNFSGDDPRLVDAAWLQELRGPRVWVDGDRFAWCGQKFRVFPWIASIPASASPDEIWLIHAPPDLSPTSIVRGGPGFGDFELGELCRSEAGPRLVLSGHVHDRQAWCAKIGRTWSLNPGRPNSAGSPNYISIRIDHEMVANFGTASGEAVTNAVQRLSWTIRSSAPS